MKWRLFSQFVVLLVISNCLGAPMSGEDDDYEDDAEYDDRRHSAEEKLQEMQEKNEGGSTTSTTTSRPIKLSSNPLIYREKKKWAHAKEIRGYQILSDGPKVVAEMVKMRPMLRIRVDSPGEIRDVEKTLKNHVLELKIRQWNAVHKIHIKVPFGYQPEDLRVAELRNHIDIVAPIFTDADESE